MNYFNHTLPKLNYLMVPEAGLEPARYFYRGILSPLCLPIPPLGHKFIQEIDFEIILLLYDLSLII